MLVSSKYKKLIKKKADTKLRTHLKNQQRKLAQFTKEEMHLRNTEFPCTSKCLTREIFFSNLN